jgi:MFS transporter, DHA3 family, macrolide efflux protein
MERSIWREQRFIAYVIGLMINSFGNAVYAVALPLMVYKLTGSAAAMTWMAVSESAPRALLGFFIIGSIVDRISRRVVMFAALGFQAVCAFLIAFLYHSGSLEIWMLYVLGALVAIGHEFTRTVEFAVLPVMFAGRRLEANAGLSSAHTLMLIVGPALAGLLLAMFDYSLLVWINAATYVGPILLCIWTKIPHEKDLGGIRSPKQIWFDLRDGVSFLRRQQTVMRIMVLVVVMFVAAAGIMTPILFSLKHDHALSDRTISWILAIDAAGMFIASLVLPFFKRMTKARLLFLGAVIQLAGMALLLIPNYWIVPLSLFISSTGFRAFVLAYEVIIQEQVPNEMRGRIGGTVRMVSFLSGSLSTTLLGLLTAGVGTQMTYLVAVVLSVLPILLMLKTGMNRQTDESMKVA